MNIKCTLLHKNIRITRPLLAVAIISIIVSGVLIPAMTTHAYANRHGGGAHH
ncbi:MAG TPA: hypothetical protein VIY08_12635 [Candidatus Nitrosocosmicus sp.]